jgi:hypothetical protein
MKRLTPQEMQRRSAASRWANLTAEERSEMMRRVRQKKEKPGAPEIVHSITAKHNIHITIVDSNVVNALIHRYDDRRDILSVKLLNKFSDSTHRAGGEFSHVFVVPTQKAEDNLAIWGEAASEQYDIPKDRPFQGAFSPKECTARVDLAGIQYTTTEKVLAAMAPEDRSKWQAQWSARVVKIDLALL